LTQATEILTWKLIVQSLRKPNPLNLRAIPQASARNPRKIASPFEFAPESVIQPLPKFTQIFFGNQQSHVYYARAFTHQTGTDGALSDPGFAADGVGGENLPRRAPAHRRGDDAKTMTCNH
jgi:hypothetical protein